MSNDRLVHPFSMQPPALPEPYWEPHVQCIEVCSPSHCARHHATCFLHQHVIPRANGVVDAFPTSMAALDGHWGVFSAVVSDITVNMVEHAVRELERHQPGSILQETFETQIRHYLQARDSAIRAADDRLCRAFLHFKEEVQRLLNARVRDPLFANVYRANEVRITAQMSVNICRLCRTTLAFTVMALPAVHASHRWLGMPVRTERSKTASR